MSLFRRAELRAGLCRDRLVLADAIVHGHGLDELRKLPASSRVTVIVSNHFVRYAVLPWSRTLTTEEEWTAFASHAFGSTHGAVASDWSIRLCATSRRGARVACAIDRALLESLKALPNVVSVRPWLMAAFNARRRALRGKTAWFVLHEPGRLTLSLFVKGAWKAVRTRHAAPDWRARLADTLDRELADTGEACESAVVCSEEDISARAGRYALQDITLPRGASSDARRHIMAVH